MKNLLKNKIVISTLALIMSVITLGMVLKPSKNNIIISDKEFIFEAGFKNMPEFKNWEKDKNRKEWAKKGFNYISYAELDTLMKSNGFIISDPLNYIGSMPDSIKEIIQKNYKELENYAKCYIIQSVDETNLFRQTVHIKSVFGNEFKNHIFKEISKPSFEENKYYGNLISDLIKEEYINSVDIPKNAGKLSIKPDPEISGMKIVAHHSLFKPGTISDTSSIKKITFKPDPMVVIKQRDGYVILAQWK